MSKEIQTKLARISELASEEQSFGYGRARASIVGEAYNKSTRVMARRTRRILETLGIPKQDFIERRVVFHDNGNSYAQVRIGNELFYVMARDPINGRELNEILDGKQPDINIVSGPCLFSAETARAITESGKSCSITTPGEKIDEKVSKFDINPHLSLYEIEALVRLSHFINTLLRANNNIDTLRLNIPNVEYYLYILPPYQEGGLVSKEQMLEWFQRVDDRHKRLFDLMARRSTKDIPLERGVVVVASAPLEPIKSYVAGSISAGLTPQFREAIELLRKESLWRDIIDVEVPNTWQELNELSYVYAELEAGYSDQKTIGDSNHTRLALVVECPNESKIFAHAKRVVSKLPNKDDYNVIALYPHESILPTTGEEKTLYHVSGQNIGINTAVEIIRATMGSYKSSG